MKGKRKKEKTIMKRFKGVLNVLLVCMLVISSSVTAFAADKASYRVVFYDESGAQIKEDIREGTVGEEVYVDIDDLSDFGDYVFAGESDKHIMNTTVKEDGTSQLSLYFKNTSSTDKVVYTVKWFYGDRLLKSEKRKAEAGTSVSIIGMDTDAIEIGANEYSFDGGNSKNVFSTTVEEDGSSELKLYFMPLDPDNFVDDGATDLDQDNEAGPAKTVYTVLWLTNDEGREIKRDIREGKVGDFVSVEQEDLEEFDDYTFDNDYDAHITRATVEPNGTTELKLYFNDNNAERVAANKTPNTNSTENGTTENGAAGNGTTANTSSKPVFTPATQSKPSETVQASSAATNQSGTQTGTAAPRTGDEVPLMAFVVALIASAGVIGIVTKSRMNKKYRRIYR